MTFLGFFLAGLFKDTAVAAFLMQRRQRRREDENLRQWTKQTEIPVLGWYLAKHGGYPSTPFERVRARGIVRTARWLVNSKTFEHLLGYALNKNSEMKRLKPKVGKAGVGRCWPRIELMS
jgi:hypothetical protein